MLLRKHTRSSPEILSKNKKGKKMTDLLQARPTTPQEIFAGLGMSNPPLTPSVEVKPPIETKTPEVKDEGDPLVKTIEYLQENFKDAPSQEQIALWKQTFGEVFMLALSEEEVYIWRALKRSEYKQMINTISEMTQKNAGVNPDDWVEERMVEKCVLWPHISPEYATFSKAGNIPTLAAMIRESSNFISPQVAVRLVRKL